MSWILNWASQWMKARHTGITRNTRSTRQDFRAFSLVPVQTSQGTSPGLAACCSELLLLALCWASCLNWETISESKVLTFKSGLVLKVSLHSGHWYWSLLFQCSLMQSLQKLCPHGAVTGSVNTSRQMEHRNWSSDSRQLAADISTHVEWKKKKTHSLLC